MNTPWWFYMLVPLATGALIALGAGAQWLTGKFECDHAWTWAGVIVLLLIVFGGAGAGGLVEAVQAFTHRGMG